MYHNNHTTVGSKSKGDERLMANNKKEEILIEKIVETKKPNFRSRTTGHERSITEAGTAYETTYEIELDENNHKTLKPTGKKHTYAEIQSYLEETKIENILAKALLGDTEALNRVEGKYMDTTEMPTTLAEAQNMVIKLRSEFNTLPLDIRRAFNYSPEEYIAAYGSESWAKTLGFVKDETVTENITEETKADE